MENNPDATITDVVNKNEINRIEDYLNKGRVLKAWYDKALKDNTFSEQFDLARTANRPSRSFGFFDHVAFPDKNLAVMGNYQEMFYDQPGAMADFEEVHQQEWLDQVREFVCHYFLRITSFTQPSPYISSGLPTPGSYVGNLSWAVPQAPQIDGFGFTQLYYKSRLTGKVQAFRDHEKFAIVDLRTFAANYEWVVLKVRIFDFPMHLRLFGRNATELVANLNETSYIVICPDFVIDEHSTVQSRASRTVSDSDILGRYGFGYAFLRNPQPGLSPYGLGEFDAAFESIRFEVSRTGKITVGLDFVANLPERLSAVEINPVKWSFQLADAVSMGLVSRALPEWALTFLTEPLPEFDRVTIDPVYAYILAANALTGGQARDMMGISRDQLDKRFLLQHFIQHYQMLVGSLLTWRQIPNWLNAAALPKWVITGGLIND